MFKSTVPDETDEERRELERYVTTERRLYDSLTTIRTPRMVAEAAAGKSKHHQLRAAQRAKQREAAAAAAASAAHSSAAHSKEAPLANGDKAHAEKAQAPPASAT